MFYTMLLQFITKPSNVIVVLLVGLLTFMFVQKTYYKSQYVELQSEMSTIQSKYDMCKQNESVTINALSKCGEQSTKYEKNIKILTDVVEEEKRRVTYWKDQYLNKKCFNNDGEVVKPSTGVIDDDNNTQAVDIINNLFGN